MHRDNRSRYAFLNMRIAGLGVAAMALMLSGMTSVAVAGDDEDRHLRFVIQGGEHFDREITGYQYNTDLDATSVYVETKPEVGFHLSDTRVGACRTGIVANRSTVIHRGQGDAISSLDYALSMSAGTPGTDWLSWPAVSSGGSDTIAGVPRTYLNVIERNVKDRGNQDVAAIGAVANYLLTGPRTTLAPRGHDLLQSKGEALDFGYEIAGQVERGLDVTRMQSRDEAAIVLKEGQRVYFQGRPQGNVQETDLGDTYLTFRNGSFQFVIDGKLALKIE